MNEALDLTWPYKTLIELYDEDFLSDYQRELIRRDIARARLDLYRLRSATQEEQEA